MYIYILFKYFYGEKNPRINLYKITVGKLLNNLKYDGSGSKDLSRKPDT